MLIPRPPFKLILLDDRGREMYSTYVSGGAEAQGFDLSDSVNAMLLVGELREAVNKPLPEQYADWIEKS